MHLPDIHAVVILLVTASAFYLYTRSWIRMEMVSLLLLLSLLVIFHLFPYLDHGVRLTSSDILVSFGHPALAAICCLMILASGLTQTGALEPAVRLLGRLWRLSRWAGLLVTLLIATAISGFVNDTPVLVLMLPMLLSLARKTGFPASRTLMPVNFAILAGGMLTTIGTSTNLLVLSIATDLGMPAMGMFDFVDIVAVSLLVAVPYLWLVAPRLLPDNGVDDGGIQRQFEARLVVEAGNQRAVGLTPRVLQAKLGRQPLTGVVRGGASQSVDWDEKFEAGDSLLVRDTPQGLHELSRLLQSDLFERSGPRRFTTRDAADLRLAEVVIANGSSLQGHSLRARGFNLEHQVRVVGLMRGDSRLLRDERDIQDVPIEAGDVLLVQGDSARVEGLRQIPGLMILDGELQLPRSPLAPWALAIMAAVIALAATRILPIHVAAFMGVIGMLVKGCVRFEGLGRALNLEVVLLVASSIALGQSLVSTGAAAWIAEGVTALVRDAPASLQIAAFMAFAAVLTNFVSNSAAAAIGTPIAVATAQALGSPLQPFVLAILFGANLSYATPMAYQTNLLIMSAARYRFADFIRVGAPLVMLMLVTLSYLLARRYGL